MITEANRSKHSKHYDRIYLRSIDYVFNCLKTYNCIENDLENGVNGIWLRSKRYMVFFKTGTACKKCGIQGQYFAVEKDPTAINYHMNLYAVDKHGCEVLMTRDHIKPRSKGGNNTLKNQQTMCIECNARKGDNYDQ